MDGGERKSGGCPDAISPADVTLVGNVCKAIRADGKFGPRELELCQGAELWSLAGGAGEPVTLRLRGAAPEQPGASGSGSSRPPGDAPAAGSGGDTPAEYHELAARLPAIVAACRGRLRPEEAAYAESILLDAAKALRPASAPAKPERDKRPWWQRIVS